MEIRHRVRIAGSAIGAIGAGLLSATRYTVNGEAANSEDRVTPESCAAQNK
jgi:hypothetical protein